MYEAFFGLRQKPFALQPDSDFVFEAQGYIDALQALEQGLARRSEITVITGDIGCGKTTLIHGLLTRLGDEISVGLIANTNTSFSDIAPWALMSFDQKPVGAVPEALQEQLMLHLIAEYGSGRRCLLIIDEAQNLTVPVVEELNLLTMLNAGDEPLLQIVLVGQPELLDRLADPRLAPVTDRISVAHKMQRLTPSETGPYVRHRLALAGAARPIFSEPAIAALHFFSEGTPRLINMLADLALVYAFGNDQHSVDLDLIRRVVADRRASGIAPFAHLDALEIVETQIAVTLSEPDKIPDASSIARSDADLIFPIEEALLPAAQEIAADATTTVAALSESQAPAESVAMAAQFDTSAELFSTLLAAHRVTAGPEGLARPHDPEASRPAPAKSSLRRRFLPRNEKNG